MPDKLVEKWIPTGLLDGLTNEIDKTLLAYNLEQCAKALVTWGPDEKVNIEVVAGILLPIVARLFREKNVRVIDNMYEFYKNFVKFFNTHYQLYLDLNQGPCYDGESEIVALFVHQYEV